MRKGSFAIPAIAPLSRTSIPCRCLPTTSPRWSTPLWSSPPKASRDSWSIFPGDARGTAPSVRNQRFWLQSRADLVIRDEDLLDGFREAGVYQFMMGLEYHADAVLKDIRKRLSTEQGPQALGLLKKHGLRVL